MRIHTPVQGLVGSIINQPSGQYKCITYVFCVVFDYWITMKVGGGAKRYLEVLILPGLCNC